MIQFEDVALFQGLNETELNHLKGCLHEKSFEKGEILFSEGNGCQRVFIVKEGRIKIFRMAENGREQIIEILGPGETCACNPGNVAWFCSSSGQALSETKVWYLSRQDYLELIEKNHEVSHSLNRIFAKKLQCFTSLIEEVSLKDVRQRLIKFLLDMFDQNESNTLFISLTREQIAQQIGTSRETVSRYLSQLKDAHLISLESHQITILDQQGLKALLK